ncbi:MAG: S9 family peptidase [Myxococcales bacterium]|nr:S9 family peptidase [Myxococcales bacterium]
MPGRLSALGLFCALAACRTPAPSAPDAGLPTPVAAAAVDAGLPRPPIARAATTSFELHGVHLEDEYAWMKKKGTPELEAYLAAENAYTDAVLRPLAPLRDTLVAELRGRMKEDDDSARFPMRGYEYWSRTRKDVAFESWWRAPRGGGAEQPLVDLNVEADGGTFAALGELEVSDDNARLAWTIDRSGFNEFELSVKDLGTGAVLDAPIPHVTSAAWAADSKTLFYTTENDAKRSFRLYRHEVGAPAAKDRLVYEEKDERFDVSVSRTASGRFLVLDSRSLTTSEARVVDAKTPTAPFKVVWPRVQDHIYDLEDHGQRFLLRVNDTGKTYRVVSVPLANPKAKPVEVIPLRPEVMLEQFHVSERFLTVLERKGGVLSLRALEHKTGAEQRVELPEADVSLWIAQNEDFDSTALRFGLTSLVTPATYLERELLTGKTTRVWQRSVPGYEPTRYETLRLEATASDGTKIPLSLARKKGVSGPGPLLLRGYGAYGVNNDPRFSSADVSLLERGVVLVEAHLRGGGELGKRWHDAGRLAKKMNTFTDFIACAEFLQREGWTTKDQLVISGMSAGGLLMGAVLNLRPDLFKAAYVEVPFVDVINTMLDESLPLTVNEFEEWGNPKVKADFEVMRAYSPYDNVKAQAYPAILVRSAYNDSQVLFHEPAKWVAKLRATKSDSNPLLLWMELKPAGHGGRANRYELLDDSARELSFMLWQWGKTK